MAKRNISYIKPQEPAFLTRLKEQAGYVEKDTVDTKVCRNCFNLVCLCVNDFWGEFRCQINYHSLLCMLFYLLVVSHWNKFYELSNCLWLYRLKILS